MHSEANDHQCHCAQFCADRQILFRPIKVNLSQQRRKGLEERAREARFVAFATLLPQQAVLVLAHHQQDQAETVLIQLLRGGGLGAISAMQPFVSYKHFFLWRPLLQTSTANIHQYATQNQLSWVEDKTNQDLSIRRNFLRHRVFTILEQQWQGVSQRLANAATWATREKCALDYFLSQEQLRISLPPPPLALLSLSKKALFSFPSEVSFLLLKKALNQQGVTVLKSHLEELLRQLEKSQSAEQTLQAEKGKVVFCIRKESVDLYPWIEPCPQDLKPEKGVHQKRGRGLPLSWVKRNPLGICARAGGEKITHKGYCWWLKKWYKQQRFPRCWRQLPLLYAGETIIGVWGLVLFDHPQASQQEIGLVFDWEKKTEKSN